MNSIPIISVTGTKGKTTTVAIIADVLQKLNRNVLKVDTTGHFINGERRSTLEESKDIWGVVPSVAPGRYLYEFHTNPELQKNAAAVLECSLGSSSLRGLGYSYHQVGVFLNVFEDHLGSSDRLKVKQDIADAKQFVFERLEPENSYAVFNADDELVADKMALFRDRTIAKNIIPVGLTFTYFDVVSHLESGGVAFSVNGTKIIKKTKDGDATIVDMKNIPWSFNGTFMPSVWNLLSAIGAVYGYLGGNLPDTIQEVIESVRLDPYGGRLTLLKSGKGTMILADYAHEKVSLKLVGELAKTLTKDGKVIGVVRLAHDRTDELLRETGEDIAMSYDSFIVYDKIDGYWRHAKKTARYPQIVGRTSEIFASGIMANNSAVERILREDEAIARAAELANPDDVVVVIVNDNIERSMKFIIDSFNAEFI